MSYIPLMEWEVEFTEEFETWWNDLTLSEQEAVNAKVCCFRRLAPFFRALTQTSSTLLAIRT
jgi:hypothetical protein